MQFVPLDTYEKFGHLASAIQSIFTVLAVVLGAAWAYWRFVRQAERYPYITFSADINFVCRQGGYWIVELISVIENKGKVPHRFSVFDFDLYAIFPDDAVAVNQEFGGQVHFPHEIVKGSWKPERTSNFFIAPGATSKYSFVARVPEAATAIMLHSWFEYDDRRKHGHTAERTVRLPDQDAE